MQLEHFQRQAALRCGLSMKQAVIVGFSGGTDSLCLLDALARCGYPVIAAHLDHQLRPESSADAARAAELAGRLGVELVTGRADVPALVRERSCSVEEAARIARYTFLFAVARQRGAQAVAVGHTADDQAETVLMHLIRGSGTSGLGGMRWRSLLEGWDAAIPLVRPLLDWPREETEQYCAGRGLLPLQDPSNQDTTFFRNRLRHELLPLLKTYNPQIKAVLRRSADVFAADAELLESLTDTAWAGCLLDESGRRVALSRQKLLELPPGLLRRVIRRGVCRLRPELRDIDFAAIDRAVEFILRPTQTHRTDLQSRLGLALENDRLILAEWGDLAAPPDVPCLESGARLRLPLPGRVELGAGWAISAQLLAAGVQPGEDRLQAWLDADLAGSQLYLRARQPGDRFQPLGMADGTLKVSDFMVNEHLPRSARAGWPLLFSENGLVWLVGYRPAHFCRLSAQTRRVLHLRLHPPAGAASY